MDRQLVISEFGVDEPKAVELVKMRDAAFRAGDIVPALRAHELILKLVSRLGPVGGDRDNGSKRKEADLPPIVVPLATRVLEPCGHAPISGPGPMRLFRHYNRKIMLTFWLYHWTIYFNY